MIQEFVCNCLNVAIKGSAESVSQEEVNYARQLIDSIPDQKRNELAQFFANSQLVKLKSFEPVNIRHNFLCLKHSFANWQINYCTICEKETHAILPSPVNVAGSKTQSCDGLVLVCMNDSDQVKHLKSHPAYSPTFGIVLSRNRPGQSILKINNESAEANFSQGVWDFLSEVELRASEKIHQFLAHERQETDDRIKNFALEENKRFDELRQTVLEEQNDFIKTVKIIKQHHGLVSDSFDKENNSLGQGFKEKSDYSGSNANMMEINADDIRKQNIEHKDKTFSKNQSNKIRSSDFDGLFDMDDIDAEVGGKGTVQEESTHLEEEEEGEEQDTFPLKETTIYSNDMHQFPKSIASDSRDEILPLSRAGINIIPNDTNSRRKLAYSVVQNIPHPYQSKNRYNHQTPNSLPIKIPHFRSRMSDLEIDEGYDFKSGESIADRIMKIAKSERNENEIDDRPRRRLNTGDIVKSRRILN